MVGIEIEAIGREAAISQKLVAPIMEIINKSHETSGRIGFLDEKSLLSMLMEGKILLINKKESADKGVLIGIVKILAEDRINEWGLLALAFKQETKIETGKKALQKIKEFALLNKNWTRISVILADSEKARELLGESGFAIEEILQNLLKTPDGYKNALLCTSSMSGRPIRPVAETAAIAAEVAQKDKVIEGLKSALEAGKNEIAGLRKQLDEQGAKIIEAEDAKDFKDTEIISALKQRVNELEAALHRLEKGNTELKMLVGEKIQHIANQAKIIEELQKSADPEVEPKEKDEKPEEKPKKEDILLEPETETSAPEIAPEELEKLISKIGLNPVPKEILKAIILQPGIKYRDLAKKANTSEVYASIITNKFIKAGLITMRYENPHNHRIASLYPVKGIVQKLQEVAKNRQENLETKQEEVTEETSLQRETKRPAELLTPFQKMVQIVKELAKNNGSGIETDELHKIAADRGLTKDETTFAIKGLKRENILTAWGNSTFVQINRENLAKI